MADSEPNLPDSDDAPLESDEALPSSTVSMHDVEPATRYRNDATWYPGDVVEGGLYRIEKVLARGGMGIIYKALDLTTNTPVVIKSPRISMLQDEGFKNRFVQEAEEWVKLGAHPNIIRAYAVREMEYLPRVIAEYAEGGSLYDMLLNGQPDLRDGLRMGVEICYGMAYAHDHGLIHRDLKPGNLLFDAEGRLKITDFGLVKRRGQADEPPGVISASRIGDGLSTVGVVGTPEYISPEQWRGKSEKSTDIYGFGVVMYEIFTGRRPFDFHEIKDEGELIRAYQKAHIKQAPPEPKSFMPTIPDEVNALILRCLAKEPSGRPANFRALARELDGISRKLCGEPLPGEPARAELDRQSRLDQAWSLLRLGAGCSFRGDLDKAVALYEQARAIFQQENNRGGLGNYYRMVGVVEVARGHHDIAMDLFRKSLDIARQVGNHTEESRCYANMGVVYVSRRDFDSAMDMYRKSLAIAESEDNLAGMRTCANNMGNIYQMRGDYAHALEMYQQSLVFAEAMGNRGAMSRCYNNIANILQLRGDLERAMEIYEKSLHIAMNLGDRAGTSRCYTNIAAIHRRKGEPKKALEMLRKSLDLSQNTGNKRGAADAHYNLAQIYRDMNYPHMAAKHARNALPLMKQIGHHATADVQSFLDKLQGGMKTKEID